MASVMALDFYSTVVRCCLNIGSRLPLSDWLDVVVVIRVRIGAIHSGAHVRVELSPDHCLLKFAPYGESPGQRRSRSKLLMSVVVVHTVNH